MPLAHSVGDDLVMALDGRERGYCASDENISEED